MYMIEGDQKLILYTIKIHLGYYSLQLREDELILNQKQSIISSEWC